MIDDLLLQSMQCVMRHGDRWAARAQGCQHYAYGRTPFEAMVEAEALRLRVAAGRPDGYCPVGGNCSNHTECDGSCSPYVKRPPTEVTTVVINRRPLL